MFPPSSIGSWVCPMGLEWGNISLEQEPDVATSWSRNSVPSQTHSSAVRSKATSNRKTRLPPPQGDWLAPMGMSSLWPDLTSCDYRMNANDSSHHPTDPYPTPAATPLPAQTEASVERLCASRCCHPPALSACSSHKDWNFPAVASCSARSLPATKGQVASDEKQGKG